MKYLARRMAQGFRPPQRESVNVDALAFDNPLAQRVAWSHLRPHGPSFVTHKLDASRPGMLVFVPSWEAIAFGLVFIVAGSIVLVGAVFSGGKTEPVLTGGSIALLASVVGGAVLYSLRTRIVFDLNAGTYQLRRPSGVPDYFPDQLTSCRLADVAALQILPERIPVDDVLEWSYELNLVLKDASRAHVVGGGKLDAMRADAQRIADALSVPVWDGSLHIV